MGKKFIPTKATMISPEIGVNYLYLPTMVSVRPLFEMLHMEFRDLHLTPEAFGLIVGELLNEVLKDSAGTNFGPCGVGPVGALFANLTESYNTPENQVRFAKVMHGMHLQTVDLITDVVGANQSTIFNFYYAGDEHFILYVPVQSDQVPPQIRSKLVPYESIRYLHR